MNLGIHRGRVFRTLAVLLLIVATAWCVLKCLGWIAIYSAYFGEPGEATLVAEAHLWARIYVGGCLLFGGVAAAVLASLIKQIVEELLPSTRLIALIIVVVGTGGLVLLVSVLHIHLHHRFG